MSEIFFDEHLESEEYGFVISTSSTFNVAVDASSTGWILSWHRYFVWINVKDDVIGKIHSKLLTVVDEKVLKLLNFSESDEFLFGVQFV